ncbi:hypothetical protein [Hoeflea sp.]|uniref:DUF6950 family protein n=1 Tax=Hoeflea sp. TaxID=1940281 RepID=UPI0019B2E1D2|nr:hypothetical protein [Hoeflea sp.]MBC7280042.1 hypothetical protein [Hoeflea sp.]
MRIEGWEKTLNAVLERHRDMPGVWGVSDCWMPAMEAYEAVTGKILAPELRGYTTEREGYRLFARHGFRSVGEALAAHLPECPVLMAGRGDLGVVERIGPDGDPVESCCVVTAIGVAVKTEAGLAYLPVTSLKRAFRVS